MNKYLPLFAISALTLGAWTTWLGTSSPRNHIGVAEEIGSAIEIGDEAARPRTETPEEVPVDVPRVARSNSPHGRSAPTNKGAQHDEQTSDAIARGGVTWRPNAQPVEQDRVDADPKIRRLQQQSDSNRQLEEESHMAHEAFAGVNRELALRRLDHHTSGQATETTAADTANASKLREVYQAALANAGEGAQIEVTCGELVCKISAAVSSNEAAAAIERVAPQQGYVHITDASGDPAEGNVDAVTVYRVRGEDVKSVVGEDLDGVLSPGNGDQQLADAERPVKQEAGGKSPDPSGEEDEPIDSSAQIGNELKTEGQPGFAPAG